MLKIAVKERLEQNKRNLAKTTMANLRGWSLARFMRLPVACRMACLAALELEDDVQAYALIRMWF